MEVEILCPKCQWEPDGGSHWQCRCGHQWNTFETAGRCPRCATRWTNTRCPGWVGGCYEWSPHLDWYHDLNELVQETVEESLRESV